jgi:hypothetical protein
MIDRFFPRHGAKIPDRLRRMGMLISDDQCRRAMSSSHWPLLDRLLYRGMRAMLFHRDLESLRALARAALLRDLNADGGLWDNAVAYARISALIWSLRWRSTAFVFGFDVNPDLLIETLISRAS